MPHRSDLSDPELLRARYVGLPIAARPLPQLAPGAQLRPENSIGALLRRRPANSSRPDSILRRQFEQRFGWCFVVELPDAELLPASLTTRRLKGPTTMRR